LPWLLINALLIAAAYGLVWADGFSFAAGAVLMTLNVAGIIYLSEHFLESRLGTGALIFLLLAKFAALLLAVYLLPQYLPIQLFWLGVGVFTVAISAACVSVPLISKQ
jgi:hypothetical protein